MTEVIRVRGDGSRSVSLLCEDVSLTKQSEAASCDINKIMAKYEKSGLLMHVNANHGFYEDVSSVPDYQAAFDIVRNADELFSSLPAEIRRRFDNDAGKYLVFVSDPANKEELVKMGIMKGPDAAPAPLKVEVVNPPTVGT